MVDYEVVPLKQTKLDLTNAIEAVHHANFLINYYGGHGDVVAMKAIFAKMRLLNMAMANFTKIHGTSLKD